MDEDKKNYERFLSIIAQIVRDFIINNKDIKDRE